MATFTNQPKSSTSYTNAQKGDLPFWSDSRFTWSSASIVWGGLKTVFSNQPKNSTSFSNQVKN